MRESGLRLNMEVQRHGQEELQGLRPRWFPAVLAFAEVSHWRRCRMVGGCAHRFEVLVKSDRDDNHLKVPDRRSIPLK